MLQCGSKNFIFIYFIKQIPLQLPASNKINKSMKNREEKKNLMLKNSKSNNKIMVARHIQIFHYTCEVAK
jgi:hypothetical protein